MEIVCTIERKMRTCNVFNYNKTMKFILHILLCCFSILTITAQETSKGRASFYSKNMNGRKTASGELFYSDSMTCAHKKLPFGTRLRVFNPKNGKEVIVRVIDRGPYRSGFILDLSYAAAKELDIVRAGHAPVEVTVLPNNLPPYKPEPMELPQMETAYTPMVDMRNHKWTRDTISAKRDSVRTSTR